jgi:uncharacterized protein DUF3310
VAGPVLSDLVQNTDITSPGFGGIHPDPVNHPAHYTSRGIECIDVAEGLSFCLGNALKYIWRAGLKGDPVEELKKARWYLDREIKRLEEQ